MARPLTADQIIAALEKWRVPYREYDGWRSRTRPHSLGWGPINGFVVHHTGGGSESASYLKFLFVDGKPGIPGPLCNFAAAPDGTIWVGAVGRANDSGRGSSRTLEKVIAEGYPGYSDEIEPGPDDFDGNERYYDVEMIYSGFEPPSGAQYASTVRLAAAIVDAYGWSALSVIGHREHSGRKWDPGQVGMAEFRRDVRELLKAGPEGDDDMDEGQFRAWFKGALEDGARAARGDYNKYGAQLRRAVRHILNGDQWLTKRGWMQDNVVPAPRGYEGSKNTHWMPSSISRGAHYYSRIGAERSAAILDAMQGLDTQQILDRIDQRSGEAAAERDALADQLTAVSDTLDGMGTLLHRHAEGMLDADDVVDGIRELLHDATAPPAETDDEA